MLVFKDTRRNKIVIAEGKNLSNYTILYSNNDKNKIIEYIKEKL